MGRIASVIGSHPAVRLAMATCLAGLLAGCADSQRLADPFGNPFYSSSRGGSESSSSANYAQAQPTRPVHSRPLAAPTPVAAYTAPAYPSRHLAWTPSPDRPMSTGSIGHSRAGVAGWTAEGGMPVVVATGESAALIAKRYGIPEQALLRTNGFYSAAQIRPGTRLVIPVYNAALAASSGADVSSRRPRVDPRREKAAREAMLERKRADARREKLAEAAREQRAEIAKRERAKAKLAKMRAERIEHTKAAEAQPSAPAHEKIVAALPQRERAVPSPAVDRMPTATVHPVSVSGRSVVAAAAPEFRWPARGRIIQSFKIGRNDGINIALPEGTSVHAAEDGVVAYAGNQLKGYGNLILIRHPDGFVTAYANNGEIDVRLGEKVRRGQVIAKSGQSGNVTTPQLHFELRKGSRPVDPTQYLAGL